MQTPEQFFDGRFTTAVCPEVPVGRGHEREAGDHTCWSSMGLRSALTIPLDRQADGVRGSGYGRGDIHDESVLNLPALFRCETVVGRGITGAAIRVTSNSWEAEFLY